VQRVEIRYYLDVLSSWCYIADLALSRIAAEYGEAVAIHWQIAQLFEGGPVPYDAQKCAWYYARTKRISGVALNAGWLAFENDTTAHANLAAEACRSLGAGDSQVRRGLAHAALIEGRRVGQRDVAIETAAGGARDERWGPRTLDLDIVAIDGMVIRSDKLVVPHPELPNRDFWLRELGFLRQSR